MGRFKLKKSGLEIGTRESSHVQTARGEGNPEGFLEEVRISGIAKVHRSP